MQRKYPKCCRHVSHDYIWSGDTLLAEVTDDYILKFFYDASGNVLGFEYLTPETLDDGITYYYEKNIFGDVVGGNNAFMNNQMLFRMISMFRFTQMRDMETDFGFVFKYNDLTFFIFWDDDDNQYLQLTLTGVYNVDDNNREDALVAANQVNIEWKVIKTVVYSDEVWVVAEQLIDKDPNLSDMIPRTIQILMSGRRSFYEHLEEL